MGIIDDRWKQGMTRRRALAGVGAFLASSPLLRAQQDARPLGEHRRALGIDEMKNVWDFQAVCAANVPQTIYDYTAHGDGNEWTLERNRTAFEWVDLLPGKAVDPKSVSLATQIYDTKMSVPLMISPSATMVPLHPTGESGCYQGAAAVGVPMAVTINSSQPFEKVAAAANGTVWWQLYGREKVEENQPLLESAQKVGAKAIIITVDQQASFYARSQRDRNLGGAPRTATAARGRGPAAAPSKGPARYGIAAPGRLWYTWKWLEDVAKFCSVPVVIKGIVTGEDAQICVDHGWGVFISNHGGRSLNYQDSTFEVLPEIAAAVKGRVPIIIDSGFRRGADCLKALALGANVISLGRVPRWGLAAFGPPGVQRILEMVRNELAQAAASAGRTSMASIDKSIVRVHLP